MANAAERKIALVTGGNKGIGFEVARQLGRAGMLVLIGARNLSLGQAAAGKLRAEQLEAHAVWLDLTQAETIDQAARFIDQTYGRLDVLVNNAGIADPNDGQPGIAGLAAVRKIFETNFLGTLAVTQAMLQLLNRAAAARIVNVSSGLGSLALNADPKSPQSAWGQVGYSASKAALNMMTVMLANELRDTAIKVNSVAPGFTATDMNQHRGTQTVEEGAVEAVRLALLPPEGPSGGFFRREGVTPW